MEALMKKLKVSEEEAKELGLGEKCELFGNEWVDHLDRYSVYGDHGDWSPVRWTSDRKLTSKYITP